MNRPTVMYFVDSLGYGGTESYLADLLPELVDRYNIILVVSKDRPTPFRERLSKAGVTILTYPVAKRYSIREAVRLGRWMRQYKPSIVQTLSTTFHSLARTGAALFTDAAIVFDLRNAYSEKYGAKEQFKRAEQRLRPYTDYFLCNSPGTMRDYELQWKTNEKGPLSNCSWFHGMNLERFTEGGENFLRSEKLEELGLPSDARFVGTVARFHPQKRYDLFIDAAALIAREKEDVHFLIVGNGPDRDAEEIQHRIRDRGLAGRFHILRDREDTPELYRLMDVFVLCSDFEGFGRVVVESISCRTPVVVSSRVNAGELFEQDKEIIRVGAQSAAEFANAVRSLLDDPPAARALAERALARAGQFEIGKAADSAHQVYQQILADPGSRQRIRRWKLIGELAAHQAGTWNGRIF